MVSQLPESLIRSVIAALIAFACFQSSRAQKSDPPRFERYSADVYAGKPAPLNLRSHRLARLYRTSIREQLHDEGINFAGHYTLAVMGCGTGCSITAIVDARNGKAYFPRALNGWSVEPGIYDFKKDEDVRTFRTNSRLLKIIGAPRLSAEEKWGVGGVYYYEWINNQLRQVYVTPVRFLSKEKSLRRGTRGACLPAAGHKFMKQTLNQALAFR